MKRSLNLMSEQAQKRDLLRRCYRLWSRILACVVVLLVLTGGMKWRLCQREYVKQANAEAEYEPVRQLKIECGRLSKDIQSLETTESLSLGLAQHKPLLSLIGMTTQVVSEQQGKLYVKKIEIEREPVAATATQVSELSFALQGVATEKGAITGLVDSLRNVGPFAKVELRDNKVPPSVQDSLQVFSIECTK